MSDLLHPDDHESPDEAVGEGAVLIEDEARTEDEATHVEDEIAGEDEEHTVVGDDQERTVVGDDQERTVVGDDQEHTVVGDDQEHTVITEDELLAGADIEDDGDEAAAEVDSPYDRPGAWYVVHTYAGYENKVKSNLESRISSMNMEDSIFEVTIPMEDVIEFKGGKKVVVQKKVFPGYLLVRCWLDDDSWRVVRNTPGVTGFVGNGAKPVPLSRKDVETFLQVKTEGIDGAATKKTRPRLEYELGETVRVKEGPFADFTGVIAEINEDRLELKVLVNIFGRETPVQLEFSQVAKL